MKKLRCLSLLIFAFVFGFTSLSTSAKVITVQKGDSMWLIAQKYHVPFQKVLDLNKKYSNPHLIHPMDKIVLPDGSTGTSTDKHSETDNIQSGNDTTSIVTDTAQAQAVLKLVNAERSKNGLSALTLSTKLTSIANVKAQDMAVNHYFSHTSPTYGSPFQMLQSYGVSYKAAGENIAAGQKSAQEVMQSWMNSSGHRANILNANYTEIGIGYYKGGSYGTEWVQLFIGK